MTNGIVLNFDGSHNVVAVLFGYLGGAFFATVTHVIPDGV